MMDGKIKVPEGMRFAVEKDLWKAECGKDSAVNVILKASILWLDGELKSMRSMRLEDHERGYNGALDDVRRMFLDPEPEVPEDVRPLLKMSIIGDWVQIHSAILEAYRRGQKAGAK
jgi:hypothetical protein